MPDGGNGLDHIQLGLVVESRFQQRSPVVVDADQAEDPAVDLGLQHGRELTQQGPTWRGQPKPEEFRPGALACRRRVNLLRTSASKERGDP